MVGMAYNNADKTHLCRRIVNPARRDWYARPRVPDSFDSLRVSIAAALSDFVDEFTPAVYREVWERHKKSIQKMRIC